MVDEKDDERKVCIHIKDIGIGIKSSIIPNLFSILCTKSTGGTGLELYIYQKE